MDLEGRGGGRRCLDFQGDAVRDVQAGVAPLRLDEAHHVAGQTLGLEVVVDGGVEGHDPDPVGEGATLLGVAGTQHELEFAGLEPDVPGEDPVVGPLPVPGPHGGGDALGVGPEPGPEGGMHEGEHLVGDPAHLVGEHDLFDVDLVVDQLDERAQAFGSGRGHGQAAQGESGPQALGFADGVGGGAHVAHQVHGFDQLGVGGQLTGGGPVGQVDAAAHRSAPATPIR